MSAPRVFVVEDEEDIARVLTHLLVQLRYTVCGCARNGEDALAAIPEVHPDLVLMDVELPGRLNGIETALRLRELCDTAIVVITASSDSRTIRDAVEAGAFGYLVKPFESRDLQATLLAALSKHKVEQLLRLDKQKLEASVQQRSAELNASEAKLRDIFDHTSDLIQSVSPDGRILYANRAWCETLGYAPADWSALNISDVIAPDYREQCEAIVGRLSEGVPAGLVEMAFISRQGRRIEVEGSVNVAFEAGLPVSIRGIFRDVTGRKAAEAALLRLNSRLEEEVRRRTEKLVHSENELRLVWESSLEAMRLTDAQGTVRRVNEAYCRLVRQSRESLEGQAISLPYAADDHATILAGHNRRFQERNFLARFETTVNLRDGTTLELELANAFVSSASEPELLLTVLRDVTARKQIERSLRLTQFSVDRASDGVFWIEPDATIRYVNDSACRSLGLAREQLVGKKASDFDPNFPAEKWPAHWAELKQKKTLTFEMAHRTNGGALLHLEVTANFIEFESKEYNCAFMRDISERKHAEQILRASEQRLERVVNNIHDALIIDDMSGRVVFANKRFFEIFGRTRARSSPLTLDDYVAPEWRERLRDRHSRQIRGEVVPEQFEYEGLRGDGTRVWVAAAVTKVVENGQVVGTQSAVRDITERKRAELSLLGANRRSSVLAQLGRELAEVDTPRAAALSILEGARQLLGWDSSWLQLWNENKRVFDESVNFDLIDGERREVPSNPYALSHPSSAVRRTMQNGAYLHLRETQADEIEGCRLFGNGRRSLSRMFVAVRRGERLLGVLSIQSYERNAYDRPALELLQLLADHCAGALARIQAGAALGESEARFRGLFGGSPIPILLSEVPDGRMVEANVAALESFGYRREEIVGRTTAELGIWVQPEQRTDFFRRLATGNGVQGFEAAMRTRSGAERIMLCSGTLIEIAGRSNVLTSAVDITAVRQAEIEKARFQARLFQSQKSEALGTLAGGVAHDFNNILTGVLNWLGVYRTWPRLRMSKFL